MDFIYKLIKLNRLIRNPQIKLLAVYMARRLSLRHLSLRVDPITTCNLKCRMCAVPNEANAPIRRFSEDDRIRLGRMLFNKALQVVIGCGYEPTMHKHFMHYIKMARDYRVPYVGLTSNAQLLDVPHIEQFMRFGLSEITISIHGLQKDTYQRFMVSASYEKLHEFLKNLDRAKTGNKTMLPSLRINFIINSENLDELPLFFKYFGKYGIKTLQIRPMHGDFYPEGRLNEKDCEKYQIYLKALSEECAKRNITLMAHAGDLNFRQDNFAVIIYPEIFYHMNPNMVWRPDFAWRDETYESFCRRIKYNNYLISSVFSRKRKRLEHDSIFSGSGRFDIFNP